jgi:hypothetical protein
MVWTAMTLAFFAVTVSWEERDCIVCLEIRADELMRRLISGELTNYSVVRTGPEPLHSGTEKCFLGVVTMTK